MSTPPKDLIIGPEYDLEGFDTPYEINEEFEFSNLTSERSELFDCISKELKAEQPITRFLPSFTYETFNRPRLQKDFDKLVDVFMGKWAITNAEDEKPILATFGAGPCLAVAGYLPEKKAGFVAHYSLPNTVLESNLLFELSKYQQGDETLYVEIHMTGEDCNKETVDAFKKYMTWRKDIVMEIVEEHTSGGDSSIALDTRTGETFSYSSLDNPHYQEHTKLDELKALLGMGGAELAYASKNIPDS
ncbi:MAG: hypothetical protein GOV00_02915 [Candidatus Altiarchaeota archaeon]|nr:hypothetical protein [Candidatus Altiarchaeota archaeon]